PSSRGPALPCIQPFATARHVCIHVSFFNDPATPEIYTTRHTLSLHDALPIFLVDRRLLHPAHAAHVGQRLRRSEEHTSELQSRLVISYAVFCLKKKKKQT